VAQRELFKINNFVIGGISSLRKGIHKYTWKLPDGHAKSCIHHAVICFVSMLQPPSWPAHRHEGPQVCPPRGERGPAAGRAPKLTPKGEGSSATPAGAREGEGPSNARAMPVQGCRLPPAQHRSSPSTPDISGGDPDAAAAKADPAAGPSLCSHHYGS